MIAHVARLAIWEWHKLRRRWIQWILLGIIVLIFQGILWGFYIGYHVSDDAFGSLIPPHEYTSIGTGQRIEFTCADLLDGSIEEKLASIPVEERQGDDQWPGLDAELEEWQPTCLGYVTPQETRAVFTLPFSLSISGEAIPLFAIPTLILAASIMGVEYGWGTLRTTLTRGVGRWQLLASKLVMMLFAVIAAIVILALTIAVASILAGIIPPDEGGPLVFSAPASEWIDLLESLGKMIYALVPYIALGIFLAVLTQSTAQGISFSLGYYIVELILAPILGGINDRVGDILEVALIGQNTSEWMGQNITDTTRALGNIEPSDTVRAFFIILAYSVALIAAAVWIFMRRDIGGAKGS